MLLPLMGCIAHAFLLTSHSAQRDWLADWPAIARLAPVAYATVNHAGSPEIDILNRRGEGVGSIEPPADCLAVGSSNDRHLTYFALTGPSAPFDTVVAVVDDAGHRAQRTISAPGANYAWTPSGALAVFGANPEGFHLPSHIGTPGDGIVVPVVECAARADQLSIAARSGDHSYVSCHVQHFGTVAVWPPPVGQGAVWLDASLHRSEHFLEGENVDLVAATSDGQYVAAANLSPSGNRIQIIKAKGGAIVFERRMKTEYIASGLLWSRGRRRLAFLVGMRGGASSEIWIYDLDLGRLTYSPAPSPELDHLVWLDDRIILAAAGAKGRRRSVLERFDCKTDRWSGAVPLPEGWNFGGFL